LVQFEQIFDSQVSSRGVLRLRATLEGEGFRTQRTFATERPAPTADTTGGVSSLVQCSDDLADSIAEWVSTTSVPPW
jgi:cholesterol transport system auxiliary component